MIDKYKYFEVFELENGWLLKYTYPTNPLEASQISHIVYYCKDVKDLLENIKGLVKHE